ncbi:MAG: EamA family transporter [Patescibacteria group bacterium]
MWMLLAAGSAVAAAFVAIFGKIGLKEVDPTLATIVRGVIMAVILVISGFLFGKWNGFDPASWSGKAWLFIVLAALAGAASWILYFMALKAGPAGSVAVIDKLSVVIVIIAAAIFLGEALTWKSMLGVVLTVIGTVLIVLK